MNRQSAASIPRYAQDFLAQNQAESDSEMVYMVYLPLCVIRKFSENEWQRAKRDSLAVHRYLVPLDVGLARTTTTCVCADSAPHTDTSSWIHVGEQFFAPKIGRP
jgi:hypothetical protein